MNYLIYLRLRIRENINNDTCLDIPTYLPREVLSFCSILSNIPCVKSFMLSTNPSLNLLLACARIKGVSELWLPLTLKIVVYSSRGYPLADASTLLYNHHLIYLSLVSPKNMK